MPSLTSISGTLLVVLIAVDSVFPDRYTVVVASDGPIVAGGTVHLNATVYDGNEIADGKFSFKWEDDAIPTHRKQELTDNPINYFNITYNSTEYSEGRYLVDVEVKKYYLWDLLGTTVRGSTTFYITETLNGDMNLIQSNHTRDNEYVSTAVPVVHYANIKQPDLDYIHNATSIYTYWFVDCVYYGLTSDFKFQFNYTKPEEPHNIQALVVADFNPPPPPPTTTTVAPTTTTTSKTTTKTTTSTTQKPKTTSKSGTKPKRSVNQNLNNSTSKIMMKVNGTLVPFNLSLPYICNSTVVPSDSKKTYGFFNTRIIPKNPISKVNVTGNNWLQHGELLNLNVKCTGSKSIEYCLKYFDGIYNVTGNETCNVYEPLSVCDFKIQRYFIESDQHTVITIIKNEVSKVVTPVAITIYKAKIQAQLSVVVVPVAFSLIAVVLVIFGVAYYFQNRSRFVVEVADFNFGQQYTDMEYKTFRERLRDSISNAFTGGPSPSSSEVPVWPPGRKYGSMT